jgi:diguanylate cyclase (GGDEF)-like protein/PAS domain S-box-containing protein
MEQSRKLDASRDLTKLQKTIDEMRQIKEKLQRSEEMYRFLAENSMDAIWQLDDQLRFVYVSPAIKNLLGYQPEEVIGHSLFGLLDQESSKIVSEGYTKRKDLQEQGKRWESSTYTVEVKHRDGHSVWMEVTVNPIFAGENQFFGYNGISRDISERRRNEELIRQYAFHDPLTNLPNRRSFEDVLETIVAQHKILHKPFAVLFLDVDGLKKINDVYGHAAGDALLQAVADRLCQVMRKQDFVARLAGDEFMAILPEVGEAEAASLIVSRLLESFHRTIVFGANKAKISVSVGISFFPSDADNVSSLMNYADQAMYKAKRTGGGKFVYFGQMSG